MFLKKEVRGQSKASFFFVSHNRLNKVYIIIIIIIIIIITVGRVEGRRRAWWPYSSTVVCMRVAGVLGAEVPGLRLNLRFGP